MKRKFVRQAKLPDGAYKKDLKEVLGKYTKSEFNTFNTKPNEEEKRWLSSTHFDETVKQYEITVVCPRCQQIAIRYLDGKRLMPIEVEHCGVRDTFYIGVQL